MDPRSYSASDKSRDGTFVRIRAIRQDDGSAIEIDPDADVSLVATVWIEGRERIVGIASYVVDPWSEPCRAEVAFVVLDAGVTLTEEEFFEYCKTEMVKYKRPVEVHFVDSLPKTGTNKINRLALRERV